MSTQKTWNESYDELPKFLSQILGFIGWFLKLPNIIWNIPFLSKMKGIRLLVLSGMAVIYNFMGGFDFNIIAESICGIYKMIGKECDPALWVKWLTIIYAWLAAGLVVEDKSK